MNPRTAGASIRQWLLVLSAAVGAIVLAAIGFATYLPRTTQYATADAFDIAYYTAQLFVVGAEPLSGPGPYPVTLEIARFLAPAATIVAVVETVRALLSERIRRWAVARARGHVVVIGDDPVAQLLAQRFADEGRDVVLVGDRVDEAVARRHDLATVRGDPRQPATLRSSGACRAATVYVCGQRSATNVAVALAVQRIAVRNVTVEAEVRDAALFAALKTHSELDATRTWLNFFVLEDLAARALLAQESLVPGFGDAVAAAVVGAGRFAAALVRQLDRRCGQPPAIVVPERDADTWNPPYGALRVYVGLDDVDASLRTALRLRTAPARRVVLCLPDAAAFAESFGPSPAGPGLPVFGIIEAACDAAPRDHLDDLGSAIHDRYLRTRLAAGDTPATNASMLPWPQLPEYLKRSNRAQANHIGTALARIGCAIVPAVEGGEPFAYRDGEIELLAELEHRRWLAERRASGYTHGTTRTDHRHPDMVAWPELPEPSRDKDRDAVRYLPALLASAGYHILRL